jgi:hypothetical protein
MSNHFSAAYLKFPGDDACLDLTDLYVFNSPAEPGSMLGDNPEIGVWATVSVRRGGMLTQVDRGGR